MNYEELLKKRIPPSRKKVAVAAAEDEVVLSTVCKAYEFGVAEPILCGDRVKIEALAKKYGLDISSFEVFHTTNGVESAELAVSLVKQRKADMLMKGLLQTADLLRAVLNKENGLRGGGVLSHVSVLHSPILDRMLLLTDAAMVTYPDLKIKAEMIRNAVIAAKGLDIENPKVAVLAAVETVNPEMQATLDAAGLTVMNRRGQIRDCVIDGPLAMDLALSEDAAKHKGVVSEVAGAADILLFNNIDAANSALKVFTVAGNCFFGGIVMGATAPIVLTSRSDTEQSKLYSIACAASVSC